jgi:hypothetical protein
MALTLSLPPELERLVRERAASEGKDVNTFAIEALQDRVRTATTFDQAFAPIREAFKASGLTSEQIGAELDNALQESRRERRKARGPIATDSAEGGPR